MKLLRIVMKCKIYFLPSFLLNLRIGQKGFPPEATLIWGGFTPDRTWSKIDSYYLVCFHYGLNWHYDIGRNERIEQLSIELPITTEKSIRRVRAKKVKTGSDSKEGTNNQ